MRNRRTENCLPRLAKGGQCQNVCRCARANKINGGLGRFENLTQTALHVGHISVITISFVIAIICVSYGVNNLIWYRSSIVRVKKHSSLLLNQMMFPIIFVNFELWHCLPLNGNSCLMNAVRRSRDQRVPVKKWFFLP